MSLEYLPTNDRELLASFKNFNKVAASNKVALGFTNVDITELTSAETNFDANLSANVQSSKRCL